MLNLMLIFNRLTFIVGIIYIENMLQNSVNADKDRCQHFQSDQQIALCKENIESTICMYM